MTDAPIPAAATGVLIIDLDQLAANWKALAKLVAPAECAAVVKADAYGLGAEYVIPALVNAGCRSFFIATPGEAAQARFLAPDATIYVLDGLLPGSGPELLAAKAIPILSNVAEVREWAALAETRKERLATALQVDTGLNRLGLDASDVAVLTGESLIGPLDVCLVMSHLACADNPADPKNREQREIFGHRLQSFPGVRASLAASDGLMLGADYHYDLVRPGYALYGGQASQAGPAPVGPVVTVQARILQVRGVAEGETVGYSATWRARKSSRVAVIAAGYDDGIARGLSRGSGEDGYKVKIRGKLAPVIGRVSMDLITVDVTTFLPFPERGEFVELIGPGLTIESMGTAAGTIGYEVLTRLGRRFHRVYTGAGS